MDLALLGKALTSRSQRARAALAAASVAGVTALDIVAATKRSRSDTPAFGSQESTQERSIVDARTAITVKAPADRLYAYWRDFGNLPSFMFHLESVTVNGGDRSHWVAKAPMGSKVEWDAEITEDVPGECIAWRSAEDASVTNSGVVRFQPAPGDRGT